MDHRIGRARTPSRTKVVGPALAAVLVATVMAACSSPKHYDAAAYQAMGSAEQVAVTGASPGTTVVLVDRGGDTVATGKVDGQGSYLFRQVKAGDGYRVRQGDAQSPAVTVMDTRPAPADTSIYRQVLPTGFDEKGEPLPDGGYGYMEVRDGTTLAVNVRLPGPADKGPYPTVIEYGGYAFARPGTAESSISPIWNALGYAVVDVNMRGTGCSGGAFDFFEPLQSLDGYDAVETVAAQPWVMNHRVGMVGISYGGISQLFVGRTNPPHLAAISPDSVIEGVMTTLRPGAILNTGFALTWAEARVHDAKPASADQGQPWAWKRIQEGDRTCKDNQKLHSQAADLVERIHSETTYDPALVDPITPATFVDEIKMPVLLACQWQDEQTGGACPFLADKFSGNDKVWTVFTNGTHIDSIDPATLQRTFDLMEIYVAGRKPDMSAAAGFIPLVYSSQMGVDGVTLPDDPIQREPDLAHARAAFEKLPRFTVMFENGTGGSAPGVPVPGFTHSWDRYPPEGLTATSFYLGDGGTLTRSAPSTSGSDSFAWDPTARPPASMDAKSIEDVWKATPPYAWTPLPAGKAVAYATAPLDEDTVVVGGGALDIWLRSTATDTDLQVTVSEVRPDGQEMFVQNGWLRASYRKLDPARSTELTPYPSARKGDLAPLPAGRWSRVQIPIYAQGHVYRKGSRIRVSVEAPGGDQPQWRFEVLEASGPVTDSIARSPDMPSRLILPVVSGVDVPTPLPPCRGVRGQPCRTYVEIPNTPGPKLNP